MHISHHSRLSNDLIDPRSHEWRNLQIILLHERKMGISLDSNLRQVQVVHIHTRLLHIEQRAIVIVRVVTRLADIQQDWELGQIHELLRWLGLHNAIAPIRAVGRDSLRWQVCGGVADGGRVCEWESREAIGAGRPVADDLLFEGRAFGLEGYDGFDFVRTGVADSPAVGPGLRVRDQNRVADFVEQSDKGIDVVGRHFCAVGLGLDFAGKEGIKGGVAWLAVARPLGVEVRLRPGVELLA